MINKKLEKLIKCASKEEKAAQVVWDDGDASKMTKEDNDQDVESDPMINENLHSSNHNSCDDHHCHHEIIITRMMVKQLKKRRRRGRIALILIQQCMLWS